MRLEARRKARVRGDGLSLAYRQWGIGSAGLPVLLLHGITGSSGDWEGTAAHLPGRHIIALDARGHGDSDWSTGGAYAGDQHYADLSLALDDLAVERCILTGYSMGGGIAMIAAAAMPERIAGVVVVDAYPDPTMSTGSRRIARWITGLARTHTSFDPAIAEHFREQLAAGTANRLDLWPMWEAIECPAVIVRGEESDVLPASTARRMLARQPRANLVEIPGVAHGIPYARPGELAVVIEELAKAVAE